MPITITKIFKLLKASHKENATEILRELLISQNIIATASDNYNDDHVIRLPPDYWQTLSIEKIEYAFLNSRIDFEETMGDGRKFVTSATVFVDDWAIDLLPSPDAAQSEEPFHRGSGEKRGPKPEIDWQVIWAGVAVIITRHKECPHQSALANEVAEWCDENFGEGAAPSESMLKETLSGLHRILGGERPAIVFPMGVRPARKRQKAKLKHSIKSVR